MIVKNCDLEIFSKSSTKVYLCCPNSCCCLSGNLKTQKFVTPNKVLYVHVLDENVNLIRDKLGWNSNIVKVYLNLIRSDLFSGRPLISDLPVAKGGLCPHESIRMIASKPLVSSQSYLLQNSRSWLVFLEPICQVIGERICGCPITGIQLPYNFTTFWLPFC